MDGLEENIIHLTMAAYAKGAQIVNSNAQCPYFLSFAYNAFLERAHKHVREERHNVNVHVRPRALYPYTCNDLSLQFALWYTLPL